MEIEGFYFQFPLYTIAKPNFIVVAGCLAVFTEEILAERWRGNNTIFTIKNLDDLTHHADLFSPHTEGMCFDPVTTRGRWESKKCVTWNVVRKAIQDERTA
jgi:hypothetical protein